MTFYTGLFQGQPVRERISLSGNDNYQYFESVVIDRECLAYTGSGFSLFFSGYLYNRVDLARKYNITADTAADLLGKLYQKLGKSSFLEYDGQFTVMVYDRDKTLIYRDFSGAGPSVYFTDECFASSLKTLTEMKGFQCNPNIEAFACFLHLGYISAPDTALQGVRKLSGGQLLTYSAGQIQVDHTLTRNSFITTHGTSSLPFDEAIHEYDRLHRQSIDRRIEKAQSVGVLLSGGYDSSGNIIRLCESYNGPVSTFSIGFKNSKWSELPLAKLLSRRYHTQHHEYEIDGSEIDMIPALTGELGDLFQESGMMLNYLVMRMVKQNPVDVVLGGDGNDEIFGEGTHEMAYYYSFEKCKAKWLLDFLNSVCSARIFNNNSMLFRIKFRVDAIANVMQSKSFGFGKKDIEKLIQAPLKNDGLTYCKNFPSKFDSFGELYLNKNFLIDIEQTLCQIVTFKAASTARLFGQHLTFPYISLEMRQFLQTLPYTCKSKGTPKDWRRGKGISKYVHKMSIKDKLPAGIATQGGFTTLPVFFADTNTRKEIKRIILGSDIMSSVLNKNSVSDSLNRYDRFAADSSRWYWQQHIKAFKFFNLLVMVLWWEQVVNKHKGATLKDFT
ncbi:MAG: hypothetical protein LBL04_18025 [Bacteroidales bacterium]|jgi:asparagine synthase (glutamine-hydrolysing)|nr:hypothetical protein [Bacteroidales bacterium]